MMTIALEHYLILGALLFCIGALGFLTRRNMKWMRRAITPASFSLAAFFSGTVFSPAGPGPAVSRRARRGR